MNTRRNAIFIVLGLLASGLLVLAASTSATAAPMVKATVTIQRIKALASSEEGACGAPDWYTKVWINGRDFNNEDTPSQDDFEGNPDIEPDWEFAVDGIDAATLGDGRLPIRIEALDEDGGLCFGDELYDVSPTDQNAIDGYVQLSDCTFHDPHSGGGQLGACGTSIVQAGTAEDRAEVTFTVDVASPASAPGLRIRCTHTPVLPQPGETVVITAEALDGALKPVPLPDRLQIWVQPDADHKTSTTPVSETTTTNTRSATFTPTGAFGAFSYGCTMREAGVDLFSSWHRVTVGDPWPNFSSPKPAVPVLYTGPRSSRIDIVFIADRDSYMSGTDPQFLADVEKTIKTSYYGFDAFLEAQDKFNFWILPDNQGVADDAEDGDCDIELPALWDDAYSFADAGAILHRRDLRDCALRGDRIFSGSVNLATRADGFQVVTHETGHQPFGLADEYCCDGGYFEQDENPNMYEISAFDDGYAACIADPVATNNCRGLIEEGGDDSWMVLDPDENTDIMGRNGPLANPADRRRFDYLFGKCEAAGC